MTRLYIQYQNNSPVPIYTSFGRGPQGSLPLEIVGDLIAGTRRLTVAFQQLPNSPLASAFAGDITLHLPDGISRSASGVEEEYFANIDKTDTTLDPGCPLSTLGSLGTKSKEPLIIKSINDAGQGIAHGLTVGSEQLQV
jgi:hypothetical protein